MGVSTDAILFYGILVDEQSEVHERIVAREDEENESISRDSLAGMRYFGDENKEFGVGLVEHCSLEYPMYAIAIRESQTRARRGYSKQIELPPVEGWDERLRGFCEKYSISFKKPAWFLVSYWG